MINKETGELNFSNGFYAGPNLSREEFLTSTISEKAKVHVANGPYCSYQVEVSNVTTLNIVEHWIVILFFYKLNLTSIKFSIMDGSEGTSWDDWDENREIEKQAFYDRWLMENFASAPPYEYSWGTVRSFYDPRAGFSGIYISYNIVDESK
ncbi:MAG: hypothetical protein AB1489_02445 [Acidobacteriota bacterium]